MSRSPRPHALLATTRLPAVLAVLAVLTSLLLAPSATARPGIEPLPTYQPATHCSPAARPGTVMLGRWLVRTYGGGFGGISRRCGGSVSEHTEGRAFDWTLDATTRTGQRLARAFMARAFATDRAGNVDALARRMGIMYVIWDDHIYSAWNGYRPERYLSSSCPSLRRCSATLRHRDHLHVSLTRRAARAETSWYVARRG